MVLIYRSNTLCVWMSVCVHSTALTSIYVIRAYGQLSVLALWDESKYRLEGSVKN